MRVIVVGATGTIGQAVADALVERGHDVVRVSRRGEVAVDIENAVSIVELYESVGPVDAVVSCAGSGVLKPLPELTDEDIKLSVRRKHLPRDLRVTTISPPFIRETAERMGLEGHRRDPVVLTGTAGASAG